MVMDMFLPPLPGNDEVPQDDELDSTTVVDDGEGDDEGDEGAGDGSEDESSDGPVSRSKYEADLAAMRQELRTLVGRAQSNARQVAEASNSEALAQLREQNVAVAELFATLVSGIDENSIDPNLRTKILQTRDEIMQTEQRARMLDEIREELGISPTAARERDALEQLQAQANALADEIEDQIVAAGLDPNDPQFPWKQWAETLKTDGVRAVRRAALQAINQARDVEQQGTRREARRTAAGRTPRQVAPASKGNPLETGSFEERYKALMGMTR